MKNDAQARENISKTLKRRKGIRSNPGIRRRNDPWIFSELICRHCDEYFFKPRGMPTSDGLFNAIIQH